jgi:nitrogen fixation protein NifU and related proteins
LNNALERGILPIADMDDLAQENILDHYKHPRNHGVLEQPTVSREEHNPLCGDRVRIDLLVQDDVIADIRFSGRGCTISQAAASMLTETIKGHSLVEAKGFSQDELLELLGIPIGYSRRKCAFLSLKALKVGAHTAHGEVWVNEDL